MTRLGAVTVGQSPRDDVVPGIASLLGEGVEIVECGILDGLSRPEIRAGAPRPGEDLLVTRMADGTEVRLGRGFAIARLQDCLDALQEEVELFLLLCTDPLPELSSRRPILSPGRLLLSAASGMGVGRLGVLTPAPEQVPMQRKRWQGAAAEVAVEAASPYGRGEPVRRAAAALGRAGVELVAMNCIGYGPAAKRMVREEAGCPALLPSTLLARFAAELLEGGG